MYPSIRIVYMYKIQRTKKTIEKDERARADINRDADVICRMTNRSCYSSILVDLFLIVRENCNKPAQQSIRLAYDYYGPAT
jgi:hypothetical protein